MWLDLIREMEVSSVKAFVSSRVPSFPRCSAPLADQSHVSSGIEEGFNGDIEDKIHFDEI